MSCTSESAWNNTQLPQVADGLAQHFPSGPFDDVVVNVGLWINPQYTDDLPTAVRQLERFKVKDPRRKPTWQTTSRWNGEEGDVLQHTLGPDAAFELGWDFIDRYAVSQALYDAVERLPHNLDGTSQTDTFAWCDPAHFQPYGYTEFNNVLLNKMCENAGIQVEDDEVDEN